MAGLRVLTWYQVQNLKKIIILLDQFLIFLYRYVCFKLRKIPLWRDICFAWQLLGKNIIDVFVKEGGSPRSWRFAGTTDLQGMYRCRSTCTNSALVLALLVELLLLQNKWKVVQNSSVWVKVPVHVINRFQAPRRRRMLVCISRSSRRDSEEICQCSPPTRVGTHPYLQKNIWNWTETKIKKMSEW